MKTSLNSAIILAVTLLIPALTIWVANDGFAAGPLTPPGPPAPTGKSLDEISAQIAAAANLQPSGENVGAIGGTSAFAWDHTTRTWSSTSLSGGSPVRVLESGGNICGIGGVKASAWSQVSKTWTTVTLNGAVDSVAGSNGNFVVTAGTNAAAWSKDTRDWTVVSLGGSPVGGPFGVAGSDR